ncbi:MAG: hypothetical protein ACSHYF_08500 [Verrucomicrobiaceae bacterium]
MRCLLPFLLLAALSPLLHAMGKKPDPITLTFHMQSQEEEGPKMVFSLPVYGQKIFFRRSPEVVTKDIKGFSPFAAENGGFGATLVLSKAAAARLAAITTQNQRSWFVAMFNGRALDAVLIDQPVRDGRLVVWQGITLDEVHRFDLMVPRIGDTPEVWAARKKAVKKQLKAAKK